MFKIKNIPDYDTYEKTFNIIHDMYGKVQEHGLLNIYGQQPLSEFEFDNDPSQASILCSHGGLAHNHPEQLRMKIDIELEPDDVTDSLMSRLIVFFLKEQKYVLRAVQDEEPYIYNDCFLKGQTAWMFPVILMDPVVYYRPSHPIIVNSISYDPDYFLIPTPTHLQLF